MQNISTSNTSTMSENVLKRGANRLLLAQIRLQFEEKLSSDKEFASRKHIYINVEHRKSYFIIDSSGKKLREVVFNCEYITCDEDNINYYGMHAGYGHQVYISAKEPLFTTKKETETYILAKKLERFAPKEAYYNQTLRLSKKEPEEAGKYLKTAAQECLQEARSLGIPHKIKEYENIVANL